MEDELKRKKLIKMIIIFTILFIIINLLIARFISTKGLVVNEYKIETNKLNEAYDGLKIIHFSDLHYGSTIHLKELNNVIDKINKENPDIVVFTGDLIEKGVILNEDELNDLVNALNSINPKIETLCVKGNHDYDHTYFDDIKEKLNFHVLDNTYEYVYANNTQPIVFVGLDDLTSGTPDYDNAFSYLKTDEEEHYTIVLAHEPDQIDNISNYNIDLMLSGHSHLGQIRLPLIGAIWTPVGAKKYYDEHYIIDETNLYISGGIGTSGLKLRYFNKPSINIYRFYTK